MMVSEECQILCQISKRVFMRSYQSGMLLVLGEGFWQFLVATWYLDLALLSESPASQGCYICCRVSTCPGSEMEKVSGSDDETQCGAGTENHWKLLPITNPICRKCLGGLVIKILIWICWSEKVKALWYFYGANNSQYAFMSWSLQLSLNSLLRLEISPSWVWHGRRLGLWNKILNIRWEDQWPSWPGKSS